MSSPPSPPCVPPPRVMCPQVCPPPPQLPPCRSKPVMRRLHWAQTTRKLTQAIMLSIIAGSCVYTFLGRPRIATYREFYAKGEFEDWADEMARMGLFQSVPKESLTDFKRK